MRDSDRAAVYRAENAVRLLLDSPGETVTINGLPVVVPDERKFGRIEDVQRYVDAVLKHIDCDRPITVRSRRGTQKAHYEFATQVIAIPEDDRWAMREIVLLHEIAHHLTPTAAAHGPEFRHTFCNLLEQVLAPEARFMLQLAFWSEGLTA